jgi:hypothetical protein
MNYPHTTVPARGVHAVHLPVNTKIAVRVLTDHLFVVKQLQLGPTDPPVFTIKLTDLPTGTPDR